MNWSASTDTGGSGLKGYNVKRGAVTTFVAAPATSLNDTGLAASTPYSYTVTAIDNATNESTPSAAAGATTPACGVTAPWAKRFGGAGFDMSFAVAIDGSGRSVVAGAFSGTASAGGATLTSAGGEDAIVAVYSSAGAHVWSKRFGSLSDDRAYGVAVDRSANCDGAGGTNCVIVAGTFADTVAFDAAPGATLTSAGSRDMFLAKYSSSGAYLWATRFGGGGNDYVHGLAIDPRANCDGSGNQSVSGCVLLTGTFSGSADFGGLTLSGPGGASLFVAKLAPTGTRIWAKTYGNTVEAIGRAIAVDAAGDIAVTGQFTGSLHFGTGTQSSWGNHDVFVAKLRGTDGASVWANRYGSDGLDAGYGIAFDGSGNISATGSFGLQSGSVSFGGETWSAHGTDVFIVQLNGASGTHRWSRRCTGTFTNVRQGSGIATDSAGNVLITGYLYGSMDCGADTPTLTGVGYSDALAAKFTSSGAPVWMKRMGCPGCSSIGSGIAADPANGEVAMTGSLEGTVTMDGQSMSSAGLTDGFLVRMLP